MERGKSRELIEKENENTDYSSSSIFIPTCILAHAGRYKDRRISSTPCVEIRRLLQQAVVHKYFDDVDGGDPADGNSAGGKRGGRVIARWPAHEARVTRTLS